MKVSNKRFFTAISLVLTVAVGALIASMNIGCAAVLAYYDTYPHIGPAPNPVGVGQTLFIGFGVQPVPPFASLTSGSQYYWNGMIINVVKPGGGNETLGPFTSDPTGTGYTTYTPTQVGNYTFQVSFPGQWMNYTSGGVAYTSYYRPSMSSPAQGQVTVQQEPILPYPDVPLPTDYWTLPIYGENKGWWQISDNWLMPGYDYTSRSFTIASTFSNYTSAPSSPHVLWTTPVRVGGLIGGPYGDQTYYTGLSYEQFYIPLILQGQIIYTDHGPTTATTYGSRCLDLYTGEQLWYLPNVTFAFAQVLEMDNPNEHGGLPYLWSVSGFGTNQTWTMWEFFSANTGQPPRPYLTVTNVTAGSSSRRGAIIFGPNGEISAYYLSSTAAGNWLSMWNSTRAIMGPTAVGSWNPSYGSVVDGRRGIEWNVTLPGFGQTISLMQVNGGYVMASNVSGISITYNQMQMAFPATLQKSPGGSYPSSLNPLWVANRSVYMSSYKFSNVNNGAYAMFDEETTQLYCYDIETGKQMWAQPPLTTPWSIFEGYGLTIAYDKVYEVGFDGHVRAYNVTSGKLAWDYYQGSAGLETPYPSWPSYWGMNIADGKVYISNDEHSPNAVLWRGGSFICLDAFNGTEIFKVSGQMHEGAISNGYYTSQNNYDGLAYCFGKGPSATTVEAPITAITVGNSVVIRGTVTDISAGTEQDVIARRFPNGVPAVADESMSAWMEYVYMQQPRPTTATGVTVTIDAIDPNNNFIHIGTATSDTSGLFSYTWKIPDIPGKYTIIATFAGSASYGSSYAETAMYVSEAPPSPTPTPPAAPLPPYELYIIGTGIAIIIAVAIVGLILFRKRP